MLTVISPAKAMDMTPVETNTSRPIWQEDAAHLAQIMRGKSVSEIRAMMDLSEDLAILNRERFKAFEEEPRSEVEKAAIFAFNGDTYQGFDAKSADMHTLAYAQDHLRMLSGLYGLLRPLDAIQPYRLEMGRKLQTEKGATLYAYWGDRIAQGLKAQADALGTELLVNCASVEYFKAANRKSLGLLVITPTFLEVKNGSGKVVSFFAKRARGAMARYIVENRITDVDGLKAFNIGGYAYDAAASKPDQPVFSRLAQAAPKGSNAK